MPYAKIVMWKLYFQIFWGDRMYPDNTTIINASVKKFALYTVMLVAVGVCTFLLFFLPKSPLYNEIESFYFFILPVSAMLAGGSARAFVNAYFIGRWARLVASFISYFANGTAVFLFLAFALQNMYLLTALIWVLLLAFSIIAFKASEYFYTGIYEGCMIKAASYVFIGLSVKSMLGVIGKDSYLGGGFWISLSNILMISFVALALIQLATLVELFYTTTSRRISMWLKSKHKSKFIVIGIYVFGIGVIRRGMMGEWLIVFMVLLAIFIVFALKFWGEVKNSPEEKLAKHIQDMNFDKSKDLENVSRYIDEYVSYGKKSKLVSYMTFLGYKTGIPFHAVSNIIAPLVEYNDPEIPGMLTSEQYKAIEERNRQNRSRVIEKITSNLQLFGRGAYAYNGYVTGSNTMQDYN